MNDTDDIISEKEKGRNLKGCSQHFLLGGVASGL